MAPSSAYQNRDRVKGNIKALARGHASLVRDLERIVPTSRLVMDDGGDLNIDIGGGRLFYPAGGRRAAEQQVAGYLDNPSRFRLAPADVIEDCVELNRVTRALRRVADGFPAAAEPGPFGGFLVVLGVGLGHHLRLLAERMAFRTMIVVEPHDELLAHSLHAMDWQRLFQDLSRDGREIRFVRGANPFVQIIKLLRGPHYPFLDGSYFYLHYQSPDLTALAEQLLNQCRAMSMSSGWIEDQLTMMVNNSANFARPGFLLQEARVASSRVLPAFVVGAGPSLDADMEDIRRCRRDVVLISASSALKVLLEHGIRPDIHCELENGAGLGPVAEDLSRRFGLSDITLYASPTVDPRISPCFGRTVYFYRSYVSSTVFYADGAETSSFAEPTSGNTAVHCALSLGFREIYLFGLDFGAKDPDRHHSRHSVYFTYKDEAEMATYTPYDFDMPVPGNFGGQVMTGWLLDWGRVSVANAIKGGDGARVMNCSDGALIAQTTPLSAEGIDLAPAPVGQGEDLERALAALTRCDGDRSRPADLVRLGEVIASFLDGCQQALAAPPPAGATAQRAMAASCLRIIALLSALETGDDIAKAAFRILVGQVQGALAAAHYHASRLDGDAAGAGLAAILATLAESFRRLGPLCASITPGLPPASGGAML
ncbi:6-hydroxymethylpterin diphosphokinase MptE-like protein [Magnetospirillum sp. SS-4]|uniref:motility associated factor glycosyltransferase family protein n=1 Tax=Magnetospirillum sp. SS-4 TaxID=2681465 RepID=UPI0013829B4C|nr:6-hydroxymethylpterin diphosphokinase MptE-like protein [Magnetospirillum sp. SS-4]CAA7623245.1 conserved hypothetical protein [Magnetospirillum sp. SS-4]